MRTRAGILLLIFAISPLGRVAQAQLTISAPDSTPAAIRQVSASGFPAAADREASNGVQIRVKVHYLMVDVETRRAIYAGLASGSIKNFGPTDAEEPSTDVGENRITNACSWQVLAPARVTTSVLEPATCEEIQKTVAEANSSEIRKSPAIILIEGEQAEMNDLTQRPFVVDMRRGEEGIEPVIRIVSEGTRLRLVAHREPTSIGADNAIRITTQIISSRILEVTSEELFGIDDKPLTVQIPQQQVVTATASEALFTGQCLLVDPQVRHSKPTVSESQVPLLSRIPLVGRSFNRQQEIEVEQHLMLILESSIAAR